MSRDFINILILFYYMKLFLLHSSLGLFSKREIYTFTFFNCTQYHVINSLRYSIDIVVIASSRVTLEKLIVVLLVKEVSAIVELDCSFVC